jgi:predicted ATPase/DNA-binding winged helix-turn-helix (wHTH) protein
MNQQALSFGSFEVRPAERVLTEDGRPVPLGARALDLLVLLVERAGQVVAKDELIAKAWPSAVVEEATLRVHIAALRRHLHEGRAGQRYIVNVTGRGYSFVAPVEAVQRAGPAPTPAPQAAPGLPLPAVRLVGRDPTVAALAAKLRLRRFVTLVGPGGVGKTVVALQAALAVAAHVEAAVFVDLAPVQQPALVPSALASALGLPARQDDPSGELAAHLAGRRLLLLLDSCEHVVDAVAQLSSCIFAHAPQVHILATSREPLRCSGEWVTRLGPLELPPADGPLAAAEAAAWPALQLFAERAAAAADSFQLDDANAERVAAICRHLDGMPLAIELAAARVDAFGLQGLQAMLDDPSGLLRASGRRGAQARHQTLHATLEWSYGLLSAPEQLLLRRVGIFAGRFPLSALVAVACAQDLGAAEATYMVADLVDKSLLVADLDGERVLYRLLDTTRAYVRDKLAAAGETQACARRHAQHCLHTFQAARRELDSTSPADWLARYAPWVGELRAALDWAFATPGEERLGVELALATAPLWDRLMLVRENQANIERALATPAAARDGALDLALFAALGATVSRANMSSPQMASAWTRALELAERSGDRSLQLQSLWGLWVTELNKGHFHAALELARRFCTVAEGSPDANDAFVGDRLVAYPLHFLGDQAGARRHIERMLAGYQPTERQTHAFRFQFDQRIIGRMTLANVLWVQGEPEAALACVEENVNDGLAVGHALTLCNALIKSCCPVALLCGRADLAQHYVDLLQQHTRAHALFMWHPATRCYQGLVHLAQGDLQGGRQAVRLALDELPQARFALPQTWVQSVLALADAQAGAVEQGLATIEQAIAQADHDDERWCYPELLRVRGEVLRLRGDDASRATLEQALALADATGAAGWARRIEASLQPPAAASS